MWRANVLHEFMQTANLLWRVKPGGDISYRCGTEFPLEIILNSNFLYRDCEESNRKKAHYLDANTSLKLGRISASFFYSRKSFTVCGWSMALSNLWVYSVTKEPNRHDSLRKVIKNTLEWSLSKKGARRDHHRFPFGESISLNLNLGWPLTGPNSAEARK